MPYTATPARIRKSIRAAEYARVTNAAVLVQRPAAGDGYAQIREGFFDSQADAQILLNELAVQLTAERLREGVEAAEPFRLGQTLALTPTIPRARVIDTKNGFDRTMYIKGVSIDLGLDRNSIEVIG